MLPIDHHTNSTIGLVFGGQVTSIKLFFDKAVDEDFPFERSAIVSEGMAASEVEAEMAHARGQE